MASSHNVELEAAKFLHKLIQDSKDEPAKLATKLYVILEHMKSSGKEHSMPYQVISSTKCMLSKGFNKYVKEFHKRKERIHRDKIDRIQREKINLLKINDVEGYLRMVQDAKSDRVKQLLKETEKYLQKLGSRLREAKAAAGRSEHDVDEIGPASESEMDEVDQAKHYLESNEKYYKMAHSIKESIVEQPSCLQGGKLRRGCLTENIDLPVCSSSTVEVKDADESACEKIESAAVSEADDCLQDQVLQELSDTVGPSDSSVAEHLMLSSHETFLADSSLEVPANELNESDSVIDPEKSAGQGVETETNSEAVGCHQDQVQQEAPRNVGLSDSSMEEEANPKVPLETVLVNCSSNMPAQTPNDSEDVIHHRMSTTEEVENAKESEADCLTTDHGLPEEHAKESEADGLTTDHVLPGEKALEAVGPSDLSVAEDANAKVPLEVAVVDSSLEIPLQEPKEIVAVVDGQSSDLKAEGLSEEKIPEVESSLQIPLKRGDSYVHNSPKEEPAESSLAVEVKGPETE